MGAVALGFLALEAEIRGLIRAQRETHRPHEEVGANVSNPGRGNKMVFGTVDGWGWMDLGRESSMADFLFYVAYWFPLSQRLR